MRQEKDSNQVKLEQIELKIFSKDGAFYNLVKSANAEFQQRESRLYSEGEVEITLTLPVEGQPARPPVTVRSSGVTFDVKTGKASRIAPPASHSKTVPVKPLGLRMTPLRRNCTCATRWNSSPNHLASGQCRQRSRPAR